MFLFRFVFFFEDSVALHTLNKCTEPQESGAEGCGPGVKPVNLRVVAFLNGPPKTTELSAQRAVKQCQNSSPTVVL